MTQPCVVSILLHDCLLIFIKCFTYLYSPQYLELILYINCSKRPGVRFGRGRGREQNTFPGAGAGGLAGNYRPGSPYLAGAGNGDKPSPGAGNSRRRESRSFPD